jgi:hypothetical protein
MNVLIEETIYLYSDVGVAKTFVHIIILILGIGAAFGIGISFYNKWKIWESILSIAVCMLVVFMIMSMPAAAIATGRRETIAEKTRYEIAIDDSTNINEILEQYEFVSLEGKKLTIQDKEWRYYEGYEE